VSFSLRKDYLNPAGNVGCRKVIIRLEFFFTAREGGRGVRFVAVRLESRRETFLKSSSSEDHDCWGKKCQRHPLGGHNGTLKKFEWEAGTVLA